MNIAICEDRIRDTEELNITLKKACESLQLKLNTDFFHSGEELIRAVKDGRSYSLILMDIYLSGMNGIETAAKIKLLLPHIQIAFMTVSKEYAIDAFEINALHYLIKPIDEKKMRECLKRFLVRSGMPVKTLEIKTDYKTYKFMLFNVMKIQSRNKGVDVYLCNTKKPCHIPISFKRMEEQLDPKLFLRISRGLLVQMSHILCIDKEICRLKDGTEAIISRRERSLIRKKYNDYLFRV